MNVPDAEVEQGEENGHSLLFIPGEKKGEGKIVDTHPKCLGKG